METNDDDHCVWVCSTSPVDHLYFACLFTKANTMMKLSRQSIMIAFFFHRYGFRLNFDYMRACSLFCFQDSFIYTHTHTHLDQRSTHHHHYHSLSLLKQQQRRGAWRKRSTRLISFVNYLNIYLNTFYSTHHSMAIFIFSLIFVLSFSFSFSDAILLSLFFFYRRRKLCFIHSVIP